MVNGKKFNHSATYHTVYWYYAKKRNVLPVVLNCETRSTFQGGSDCHPVFEGVVIHQVMHRLYLGIINLLSNIHQFYIRSSWEPHSIDDKAHGRWLHNSGVSVQSEACLQLWRSWTRDCSLMVSLAAILLKSRTSCVNADTMHKA